MSRSLQRRGTVTRLNNGMVITAGPPARLMGQWSVVQKGNLLWDDVTATGRNIDRSVIEASARAHGYMGEHRVYPNVRLVVPR